MRVQQAALEALRSESDARMSDLQARADAATKEVEEVRGRALALMEEKDATIAALRRASAPPSGNATPQVCPVYMVYHVVDPFLCLACVLAQTRIIVVHSSSVL